MKKSTITLLFIFVSSIAYAQNCPTKPSCEELGYSFTQNDCAGQKALRCPLDKSYFFCHKAKGNNGYTGKRCITGDVFSIKHRRCTTEKNAPYDYIFIEESEQKSSPVAITLQQKEAFLQQGSFDDAQNLVSLKNDRMITKLQLQKILRYFLLHYEYRCVVTKEGVVYIDETTGILTDINSEEDFKLCTNEKTASQGNYYNLRIARLNYIP